MDRSIEEPGRPDRVPTVRDRMVQAAVVNVIEPIFERDFAEHSYGFRPGRGCKDDLRRVDHLDLIRIRVSRVVEGGILLVSRSTRFLTTA